MTDSEKSFCFRNVCQLACHHDLEFSCETIKENVYCCDSDSVILMNDLYTFIPLSFDCTFTILRNAIRKRPQESKFNSL